MCYDIFSTTRIESIDLSGNLLTSLPLALAALNTLRSDIICIFMLPYKSASSYSRIQAIRIIDLTTMIFRRLDMSDNQVTSVSPEILAKLTRCLFFAFTHFLFFLTFQNNRQSESLPTSPGAWRILYIHFHFLFTFTHHLRKSSPTLPDFKRICLISSTDD